MRAARLIAAVAFGGLAMSGQPSLHVLRVSPTDPAEPTAVITVTFDRPVAGQLDGTIDPRRIFSIAPPVAGQVEWRDPITLRFTPAAALTPNATYTVSVDTTFQAMDGSRLEQVYRFTFRVGGPRVLAGGPVGAPWGPRYLRPDVQFEVILSAPAELSQVGRLVYLELDNTCDAPPVVRLKALSQRPISDRDAPEYRYAGGWRRNRQVDALRRIVRLAPERPVPPGCAGRLIMPATLDSTSIATAQRRPFATHGPLRLVAVTCTAGKAWCPAGYAQVEFSTPVRGSDVVRAVKMSTATPFTVGDTTAESPTWVLEAALRPRTSYIVTVDSTLHDVFGQRLAGAPATTISTTGYAPALDYPTGSMLVEREGFRTVAVKHVNVDTLFVTLAAVPESLEARVLGAPEWNLPEVWPLLAPGATTRTIAVPGPADVPLVSAVRMPTYNAVRPDAPTLTAVRIASKADSVRGRRRDIALVQVTDLGVAVRLGAEEALVWVTTVHDGKPCAGASVVLYGRHGQVRARGTTDAQGLVRLTGFPPDSAGASVARRWSGGFDGYVAATANSDRAIVALSAYAWELSPWRFNVASADGAGRIPAAAAVFTERGIYRPGEVVHAKAIVRTGNLGALRVPARGDSLHWVFYDREEGTIRDTTVAVSPFGTAHQALPVASDLPLGSYRVAVELRRGGAWTELASTSYRVAEYRPPEFLVSVAADTSIHYAGDSLSATVEARYLFGAPMARAAVSWMVRQTPQAAWALDIPGTEGYWLGESGWWWEEQESERPTAEVSANGTDTLDATGHFGLRVSLPAPRKGRPARVTFEATVTDVNRQTVGAYASTTVHPAAFYIGAKPTGTEYFWKTGVPVEIALIAAQPDARRVPGVMVRGTIVRREWHRVQRQRSGLDEQVGEWVADTVAHCDVTTAADPVPCRFTPELGGSYVVSFRAKDAAGRDASTSFYRWATGRGWVPWGDEAQFKMDVIPDKTRYDVGDTATVLFASPFTDAEAWVTVEREGVIEQRRLRITSGATSLRFLLGEAYVPNAFVSIVVARGRSAPPGGIGDPGRPAIRVGYAELRVTPGVKRLRVEVQPVAAEYRPGDTARVRIGVRDAGGTGRRSEVTLWAVDEGVLALTGYKTPDPVDLIYRPRGVGMRLGSDLISVAAQVLNEEGISIKGDQEPGGGGGLGGGDVLRSRFSSTAFFLGSVVTDDNGDVTAAAKLPDNLTTFRVMAVAVTAGDRYGSGHSSLLVTRPLLARPALPRFLRRDDHFVAGVVVNQRAGGTPTVRVQARARGVTVADSTAKTVTLAAGRGTEVRFAFRDTTTDTAAFRFDVTNGRDSDAVLTRLPVRPAYYPRAHTVAGVLRLTAGVEFTLPADIDPERSQLVFGIGTTPLAIIGGMYRELAIYPYDCTEQLADQMLPIIALYRAGTSPDGQRYAPADARKRIEEAVAALSLRQRPDGGIGLWSADDWTTPWLSAYAGEALLAARAAGIAVRDSVLTRLGNYLFRSVHQRARIQSPVATWFRQLQVRLAEDVAAVDFLSRLGRTDMAGENELLRVAPQLAWEDRVRLAEVVARRGGGAVDAARRLLAPVWAKVRIEGRRAVLPDTAVRAFYFWSSRRPMARLLSATLAVDSASPLIGPLVETLVERGRAARGWWNTQDYGAAVEALADFTVRQQRAARRGFTVAAAGQVLFRSQGAGDIMRESSRGLTGLLAAGGEGTKRLTLTITAPAMENAPPLYYYVTVSEVPRQRPVTPDQQGIEVERWYEDYATGQPIISAPEGALVRVRLRIKLPAERRFLALTDPLPAGLEAVDLSLRTAGRLPGPAAASQAPGEEEEGESPGGAYLFDWYYGSWDSGWWSPFDHRQLRDDRVLYVATYLWSGTYSATYVARATTPGVFIRPPAHAEEMYNPAVQGRSDGGVFTVTPKAP